MSYIVRKAKLCKCGCGGKGLIYAKGMLQGCYNRIMITEKKKVIQSENQFYKAMINLNYQKNRGFCLCDNCGQEIERPIGRNVAHIISKGANPALYHDPLNHFILGRGIIFNQCDCLEDYDSGTKRQALNIYAESERRKVELKRKYYEVDKEVI